MQQHAAQHGQPARAGMPTPTDALGVGVGGVADQLDKGDQVRAHLVLLAVAVEEEEAGADLRLTGRTQEGCEGLSLG